MSEHTFDVVEEGNTNIIFIDEEEIASFNREIEDSSRRIMINLEHANAIMLHRILKELKDLRQKIQKVESDVKAVKREQAKPIYLTPVMGAST